MDDTTMVLPDVKLRFNIENPNPEECYGYGYECAQTGIAEDCNPYRKGSAASEQWIEGWWAGFYGEESIFNSPILANESVNIDPMAANDQVYHEKLDNFFIRLLEISGVIAVSAIVGYQLIELVA